MRPIYMVTQPAKAHQPIPLRLCTQMRLVKTEPLSPQTKIGVIYMYANEHVYHGELKGQHINSQLTWNDESLTALTDSLNGKRQNANIRFKEDEMILTLICEIRTGINVTIFDIEMQYLEGEVPFQHMKSLFMGFKNDYINEQQELKREKVRVNKEINEMMTLEKLIQDQTDVQINHMKHKFLQIINSCKHKIRKYMKPQRNKSILEEGNDVEEIMVLEKHRRHIKKVISPKMGYIEDKPEQQQQEENNDEFSKLFQDQ